MTGSMVLVPALLPSNAETKRGNPALLVSRQESTKSTLERLGCGHANL